MQKHGGIKGERFRGVDLLRLRQPRSRYSVPLRPHSWTVLIQIEILPGICPNAVVMRSFGNGNLNRPLHAAGGAGPCPGGVRRPGGAPGLQNQRGAQQSPRWVRFPSASANFRFSRPRPRGTGVPGRRNIGMLESEIPSLRHSASATFAKPDGMTYAALDPDV